VYILSKLGETSLSGYDMISGISAATRGSWRPGAGSVYPILKELKHEGLVKVEARGARSRQQYHITPRGQKSLEKWKGMLEQGQEKWSSISGLFLDLCSARVLAERMNERHRFGDVALQKVLSSDEIPDEEKRFLLQEQRLLLERQIAMIDGKLAELQRGSGEKPKVTIR
jgi:DNA-binding PadR family transcriptional regulator